MTSIIRTLIAGVRKFSKRNCVSGSLYNDMVDRGQSPKVMVIGCSDSLVDPLALTGAQMGELFVHRNIAALVPPYQHDDINNFHATSAVLEHGVKNLKVKHIIVMGHGCCGGIAALLDDASKQSSDDSFIKSWMNIVASVKNKAMEEHPELSLNEKRHFCEKESIIISLKNLRTFPWIEERLLANKISLHGWYFDRGNLSIYNETRRIFEKN